MQKVLHPSTLLSKECYQDYSKAFSSQMLNFAKQSEEINGTLNTDMKVPRALCRHTNVGFPVFINLRHCLLLAASDHGA